VASERLALTASGLVRYTLKTPYRDGTTHIVLEPLDLMARLAALVPKPRMHLTRYHGVFAPHSQYRAAVTPAQRGRGAARPPVCGVDPTKPSTPRHVAMSWARRLKRVFGIEIESCAHCGGKLKIIASIEEPQLIAKILSHLERAAPEQNQSELALVPDRPRGRVGGERAARHASLAPRQRLGALSTSPLAPRFPTLTTPPLSLDATQGRLREPQGGRAGPDGSFEIPIRGGRQKRAPRVVFSPLGLNCNRLPRLGSPRNRFQGPHNKFLS
jgi:hypothetical protein